MTLAGHTGDRYKTLLPARETRPPGPPALGYNLGPNTVVRCRKGHLFTTIWIPGVNLKEVDLIVARIQHCPVGKHWSLVVPVKEKDLTEEERRSAREDHDIPIP